MVLCQQTVSEWRATKFLLDGASMLQLQALPEVLTEVVPLVCPIGPSWLCGKLELPSFIQRLVLLSS